jgi:mono/diheme cytochrome c family protein
MERHLLHNAQTRRWFRVLRGVGATVAAALTFVLLGAQKEPVKNPPAKPPTFESDIVPILTKSTCLGCHGPSLKMKELNLSTYQTALQGSESGPVIVPGKPDDSRLYHMVKEGLMPPGGKIHLSDAELATIREWIESGAGSATAAHAEADLSNVTQDDVIPIMLLRCVACHGLRMQEGGLDLHTRESMLKGGKSGPAMVLGKPDQSLIVKMMRSGEMPPKKRLIVVGVKPATDAETAKVARWIELGAPVGAEPPDVAATESDPLVSDKDRSFWSFQSPKPVEPPAVKHADRVRNPIDAFLLSNLESKDLSFSPEADKLTLLRRIYFDLIGLPPEPAEIQAYMADKSPNAYEKLVDRLLASPHYGERWGRYWLDAAGYADSEGGKLSADHPRPYAWRYRDYVIQSFNADKPYDRFLTEQIAGDELVDYEHAPVVTKQMMDNLIATGFLRMAPDSTSEREVNFSDDRLDVVADEIDVFSSTVLGLTMKCAHCHSHKYDPIPQRDYYRLDAVLKGAYDEHDWLQPLYIPKTTVITTQTQGRMLPYVEPGKTPYELAEEARNREDHNAEIDKQLAATKSAWDEKIAPLKKKVLDERLSKLPKSLQEDLRAVAKAAPEERTEVQKYLAEKFGATLKVSSDDLKAADPAYAKEEEKHQTETLQLQAKRIPEPKIQALWDRGEPSPTYILRRGSPSNFGPLVQPGVPAVLITGLKPYQVREPWPGAHKTGRRLALANWLTQPNHPLTARVMVNRIWARHFGEGIVTTLGNFGHTGAAPSNQALLDWLAVEFVKQNWSIKAMHRLMMTSTAYRQSSAVTPALEKADPDNQLVSRMPLRRMDAEVLNDTILQVAGRLDTRMFGPADPVLVREDGLVTPVELSTGWRRGIYVNQRRSKIPTMLDNFDFPQLSPACLIRTQSNVAPQALHLLNNATIYGLSGDFANRIVKEAGSDLRHQIEEAYWIALSRAPSAEEMRVASDDLLKLKQAAAKDVKGADAEHQALTAFCHTILNSAAFLYID